MQKIMEQEPQGEEDGGEGGGINTFQQV